MPSLYIGLSFYFQKIRTWFLIPAQNFKSFSVDLATTYRAALRACFRFITDSAYMLGLDIGDESISFSDAIARCYAHCAFKQAIIRHVSREGNAIDVAEYPAPHLPLYFG